MKKRARAKLRLVRKCPSCRSVNVRKSALRGQEAREGQTLLSPYRCRECRERFWVVSKNTYYIAGIIGAVLVVAAVGWSVRGLLDRPIVAPVVVAAPVTQQFTELISAAEAEDPVAEHEVARRLASGEGVAKDEAEAWKWLDRSARHGNVQAQYELGLVLRDGRGTVQDYGAARTWLERAAERGHPQAQFEIGLMYREGTVVPVDPVKAYIWLNVAAARGLSAAAPVRDAVVERLTPDEVAKAQAEARRLVATFK